jgi:uncharacterized protein involved in exopolysaccharide biosynthesis
MLNDPSVYNVLLAAADTLRNISGDMRAVTSSAENAAGWAELGMSRFAENMTALQHNWLLRRYFEDRGYYERAPHETRERAIQESFQEIQQQKRELLELQQRLEEWERQLEAERETLEAALDSVESARAEPRTTIAPPDTLRSTMAAPDETDAPVLTDQAAGTR